MRARASVRIAALRDAIPAKQNPSEESPEKIPVRVFAHTKNSTRGKQSLSFRRAVMRLPSRTPPTAPLRPAHLGSFTMAGSDNPFVNADAWRKHPLLNGTWRHIAPGFFIGLTAFGAFYAYDKATQKKAAKH